MSATSMKEGALSSGYGDVMVTLLSWNLHNLNLWPDIAADATVDVALLQEARRPEED